MQLMNTLAKTEPLAAKKEKPDPGWKKCEGCLTATITCGVIAPVCDQQRYDKPGAVRYCPQQLIVLLLRDVRLHQASHN